MKLEADLHVHTVASGHAFSTVDEIVKVARTKGLSAVALTDHGPALPGGAHAYHFWNQRVLPSEVDGVRLLKGAEANILSARGDIDLEQDVLETLDLVMVAFHFDCGYEGADVQTNTEALVRALASPFVDGVAHPGNPRFPVDPRGLVEGAREHGVFIELNNSSFTDSTSRKGSYQYDLEIMKLANQEGIDIIISSDAHLASQVGDFEEAIRVASEAGIAEERIHFVGNVMIDS
ncbi:MAG: PHP domain-containing protein, partial [Terriglobia bacterium]